MVGMAYQNDFFQPPRDGFEFLARIGIADETKVRRVVRYGLIDLLGPHVLQMNVCLWVAIFELFLDQRHLVKPDGVNRRHADGADKFFLQRAYLRRHLVVSPNDIAARFVVKFAGGSQFDRAAGSIKQVRRQSLLELLEELAGRGLADPV